MVIEMSKEKELAKNTAIILFGKICTQFVSLFLVPIYTMTLSTNDYGYIDLVQTYISLLAPIIILRMDSSVFRFLVDCRNKDEEKSQIISSSFFVVVFQLVFFLLIFIIITLFFDIKYAIFIFTTIITVSVSNVLLQITRGNGRMTDYSIASIIAGLSTALLNILFIFVLKKSSMFILISSTIGNTLCIIYIFIREKLYRNIKIKNIKKKRLSEMIKYSIPMIPDGLSWWIVNASDRTLITCFLGSSFNGIYAISCKFTNIIAAFFSIFNLSWQESASVHVNDSDSKSFFAGIFDTSFKLFSSICLLVLIFTPIVYILMIGKDYIESYLYVPVLLIGSLFNAMAIVVGGAYIAKKQTKKVARTTIASAIINIVVNVLLIKKIGLWAAAISTTVAYLFLFVYRYIDIKEEAGFRINKKDFIIVSIMFIVSIIVHYINNIVLCIVNIIIMCVFCCLFNKDIISKFISSIKKRRKNKTK